MMTTAPSPLRGVLLMLSAVFVFACMDATGKHLYAIYPVPLVAAARYIGNLVLLVAIMAPRHGWALITTQRLGLVWVRALSLAAATLLMGYALQRLPLPETIAIIFVAPFGVLLLSGPLLGEPVGPMGWLAAALGFAGMLMIVRPDFLFGLRTGGVGLDPAGVLFALAGAGVAVAYNVLSRLLARTETTMAMLFHSALAGSLIFGVLALGDGLWFGGKLAATVVWPSAFDAMLLTSLGALALIGHALFTSAFRQAPAALLSPVNYVHLAWATLLGWLIFNHVPDPLALAGMALIALAGAGVAIKTHRDSLKSSG
jgi:drug/metabolite transporter (DMT)-like permease